ncbi:MAG TPA: PRC-barrel domain-containing protein, partial [Solirubrobacterales bacterium]
MGEAFVPGAALPTLTEALAWAGFELDEVGGERVGRVSGVFADAAGGEPAWLVAALGRRGAKLVVVPL